MDKELDEFDVEIKTELEPVSTYQNPTATIFEVIRMMEACPICGSKMHLTHFADFSELTSTEVGRCDECGYKGKRQLSRLQ